MVAPIDMDKLNLNPGIKELVLLLREWGYDTCDSGDGQTHDFECDQPYPYVYMTVQPEAGVNASRQLKKMLEGRGVVFEPLDEEGRGPFVEFHYSPVDGFGVLILMNVLSKDVGL